MTVLVPQICQVSVGAFKSLDTESSLQKQNVMTEVSVVTKASANHLTAEDMKEYEAGQYGPKNISLIILGVFLQGKTIF